MNIPIDVQEVASVLTAAAACFLANFLRKLDKRVAAIEIYLRLKHMKIEDNENEK